MTELLCSTKTKKIWNNVYRKKVSKEGRHGKVQKQPPEVFCKKISFEKVRKIHRKTPVPESLF